MYTTSNYSGANAERPAIFAIVDAGHPFSDHQAANSPGMESTLNRVHPQFTKRFLTYIQSYISNTLLQELGIRKDLNAFVNNRFIRIEEGARYEVFFVFSDDTDEDLSSQLEHQLKKKEESMRQAGLIYLHSPGMMPLFHRETPAPFSLTQTIKSIRKELSNDNVRLSSPTQKNANHADLPATEIVRVQEEPSSPGAGIVGEASTLSVSLEPAVSPFHFRPFAIITAKQLVSSHQAMIYDTDKNSRRKLWDYLKPYVPGYGHLFTPRAGGHYLHVDNRFIRINHSSFREVFFVKLGDLGQKDQQLVKQASDMRYTLATKKHSLKKQKGVIFLESPGPVPSIGQYYEPSGDTMDDIRQIPAITTSSRELTSPNHRHSIQRLDAHEGPMESWTTSTVTPLSRRLGPPKKVSSEVTELSSGDETQPISKELRTTSTSRIPILASQQPNYSSNEHELIDLTNSPLIIDLTNDSPVLSSNEIPDLDITDRDDEDTGFKTRDSGPPNSSPEPEPMDMDTDVEFPIMERGQPNPSQTLMMSGHFVKTGLKKNSVDQIPGIIQQIISGSSSEKESVRHLYRGSKVKTSIKIKNVDEMEAEVLSYKVEEDIHFVGEANEEGIQQMEADCSDWAKAMAQEMEEKEARLYLAEAKKYTRDEIDSSFLDRMKDRPVEWQMASYNRGIFESWLVQSTPDEPEAPPITVKNLVDDEPCPVWEFFYTNKYVRGDGVPKPPSLDQRAGCSCIGGCKDDSSTCACALAQEKYGQEYDIQGFLYDQDGCLKFIGPPILECNEACSCADYCINRVAGRGRRYRVEIRKTEKTGWGVFAGEDIPSGSFLGVYAGELLLDAEAEARGQRFYNLYNRNYLFSIDWYYIRDLFKERKEEFKIQYVIDAMHVGSFTRFLNHSCDPNCSEAPCVFGDTELEMPYLTFFAKKEIKKDDEITFCYRGSQNVYEKPEELARAKRRVEERRLKANKGIAKKVDVPCRCGSRKCIGSIWNWESSDDEDE